MWRRAQPSRMSVLPTLSDSQTCVASGCSGNCSFGIRLFRSVRTWHANLMNLGAPGWMATRRRPYRREELTGRLPRFLAKFTPRLMNRVEPCRFGGPLAPCKNWEVGFRVGYGVIIHLSRMTCCGAGSMPWHSGVGVRIVYKRQAVPLRWDCKTSTLFTTSLPGLRSVGVLDRGHTG